MAKSKGGRPTKYRYEYDEQVYKLCLLGATDAELAEFFEVDEATINRWKQSQPGFCESIRAGKAEADAKVAEALYHRALGYEHDAIKILSYEGHSWEHGYRKRYPPDTTAASLWLRNRQPHLWRDKQEVDLRTPDGIQVEELTREELQERKAHLANRIAALQQSTNGKRNGTR